MVATPLPLAFSSTALWELIGKLHPILVHFPVALLAVAGLLEAWVWLRGRESSAEGVLLVRIGALAALAAGLSGWSFAEANDPTRTLFLHRWGGIAVAVLATGAAFLVRGDIVRAGYRPLVLVLLPLVGAVGHFGGEMTWGEGYVLDAVKAVFEEPAAEEGADGATRGEPAVASTPEEHAFLAEVWPTFRDNCLGCHGPKKQKADLRFDDREVALGEPGIIVPGDPAASRLVEVLRLPADDEERMPPAKEGPPLAAESIAAIERWIAAGAAWPAGALPLAPAAAGEESGRQTGQGPSPFRSLWSGALAHAEERADPTGEELFRTVVRPAFTERCTGCHGAKKQKSDLRLDRPANVFDEGRDVRIVVPGDPAGSILLTRISYPKGHEDHMPPDGPSLTPEQIEGIRAWIAAGAPWPVDPGEEAAVDEPEVPPESAAPVNIGTRELAEVLFRASVDPMLATRCQRCHGGAEPKGDFRVDDAQSLRSVLEPGLPAKSEILRRIMLPADHEDRMPREGAAVTPVEGEALRAWIAAGAPVPERRNLVPAAGAGEPNAGSDDDRDGDGGDGKGRGRGRGRGGRSD